MEEVVVLIVGAGPAGLAMAACLNQLSIPYVILEREDCSASLWHNRAYDRLKLHLIHVVDSLLVMMAKFIFGDLSRHGITSPKMGPLVLKSETGRSAVIDVGTAGLIKKDVIKVVGGITKIIGKTIEFEGGSERSFDAIVFSTGYRSTANNWLKVVALRFEFRQV
uniref:Uncharacterized protein n=1 Tax=Avena sativa TaxID=4498 RepID=A0ACD5VUA4_AVESA